MMTEYLMEIMWFLALISMLFVILSLYVFVLIWNIQWPQLITGTPFLDWFSCFLASLIKVSFLDLENKNKPEEKQQEQQKHIPLALKDSKLCIILDSLLLWMSISE